MNLPEKILALRKKRGLSQAELADQLGVSRQAVSRWEVGSAQPDASNVLQLSKLFGVTADYLLHDDYESDADVPIVKQTDRRARARLKKLTGACLSAAGLLGQFVIYILSRMVEVMVPVAVRGEGGKIMYTWRSDITDHSYKYFIQEYDLELLSGLFWLLILMGICVAFVEREKLRGLLETVKNRLKRQK